MGLRLGVAEVPLDGSVPTIETLTAAGERVRTVVAAAAAEGARVVQFPEGTLSYPHKRRISRDAPELGEADWSPVPWGAVRDELEATAETARAHGVFVVVGAPHRLATVDRPHNSLYVFADDGHLVTRYDKRRLSMTEITYLYTPGTEPVVFEVDGFRIGLVLCLEALFPDLFTAYADDGADAVLISSAGGGIFADLARSYAAVNVMTVSLSVPPDPSDPSPTGAWGPMGPLGCAPRAAVDGTSFVVVEAPRRPPVAELFHHRSRHGLYEGRDAVDDPRSVARDVL
jgi:predicted amidohydrolase